MKINRLVSKSELFSKQKWTVFFESVYIIFTCKNNIYKLETAKIYSLSINLLMH
jgi:hypothetical protein